MPFFVITGTYHIKGYSPDGDSIRFKADNEENWKKLGWPKVQLNARRHAQLRLEAIDTLETHYLNAHQPLKFAEKALDYLLKNLGITEVKWNALHTTVTKANDGTRGYILTRTAEGNGRPVSFAYAGDPPKPDGSSIVLKPPLLRLSLNYKQIEAGLAYPTYYTGLFFDLRKAFTKAVKKAREQNLEIWSEDRTSSGFEVNSLKSIQEDHVILPKLFRRLTEFLTGGGSVSGFKEFLEAKDDPIIIITTTHATHFDTVIEVDGNTVRMTEPAENLVFGEKL
jgi:endonuclease YncB( thermonuclease family)